MTLFISYAVTRLKHPKRLPYPPMTPNNRLSTRSLPGSQRSASWAPTVGGAFEFVDMPGQSTRRYRCLLTMPTAPNRLAIYSPNETEGDIASGDLQYLPINHYHGDLLRQDCPESL